MKLIRRHTSDGKMNDDDDCDSWYTSLSYSCIVTFRTAAKALAGDVSLSSVKRNEFTGCYTLPR